MMKVCALGKLLSKTRLLKSSGVLAADVITDN